MRRRKASRYGRRRESAYELGRINAARRKTRGHATPEQLREAGRKGGRAKGARRASS